MGKRAGEEKTQEEEAMEASSAFSAPREVEVERERKRKTKNGAEQLDEEEEALDFEDPYEDEYDEEDRLAAQMKAGASSDSDAESEVEDEGDDEQGKEEEKVVTRAWRPGIDTLAEGEELDFDPSAYEMLHRATMEWSCLSFDILREPHGALRTKPPHTAYVVGGTQAETSKGNRLFIMKWSDLHKTNQDARDSDDESSDESDDEGSDEDPKLDFRIIAHQGTVNRVRCCPQMNRLVATWSDLGEVNVWDIDKQVKRLDDPGAAGPPPTPHQPPKFTYKDHGVEGYALDWNPVHTGKMLSGDVEGCVCLWEPQEGGWAVSKIMHASKKKKKAAPVRFSGVSEGASVEETQWKLGGSGAGDVFATASNDGGIRIYDTRSSTAGPALALLHAHTSDVNALRWSPVHHDLLLSGDEDGCVKVWDERYGEVPLVVMQWHKKPITSVDWHPTDEATFATSSLDDSVALWDMSVEIDEDAEERDRGAKQMEAEKNDDKMPEQLMFVHMGQEHISEIKFHPQIPGVVISTACDGFNFFKTCNI
ncbi:WD domain, G-beta repeat-containing protein [Toxoplasma gondii ME49]|uniref:WD domain, G-beta repeat-containing protein n=8 Tax=Toxoplasma gondii TaxID=5811 RepID=B6K8P5_TOXGV|nr:WD domain, G-beta repeat-containing protein [Toxoplasma gondii ME49]EPT26053.1 WD domain, G-beta repeat-containing protein [Toxoplasma gondii ME49]ESS34980.1 WD domain, G-beta repeat-containing protein [Toxoplasma gondii VEG]CEL77464.1 TPA: WD repeat protein, putative [Toxoplasma gondii VEG]|eukprot:XP_002364419.1 WD domain, G-beta repeat-containing protein [Toxoplasma gondii ME49]